MTPQEFFESKGYEFEQDEDELWKEESVSEMRWKDLFEYMQEYLQQERSAP